MVRSESRISRLQGRSPDLTSPAISRRAAFIFAAPVLGLFVGVEQLGGLERHPPTQSIDRHDSEAMQFEQPGPRPCAHIRLFYDTAIPLGK